MSLLEKIFIGHPLWPRFCQTLHQGATLPLTPLEESACLDDLREAIAYGNHKSSIHNAPRLMKILSTEVDKAWQLPLPIQHLDKIPRAVISPLGLTKQAGIDENGHIIPKWRVAHDQSFAFSSGKSVNDHVIKSELTPCQYSFALQRFLHTIIQLHQLYPTTPFLLSKFDFKSAYHHVHWSASSTFQSIMMTTGLQDKPIALASLQVTFGGAPCSSFCPKSPNQ